MKEVDYKKLGERLRKSREYLNLTQAQVAEILHVGRDAILRIENGTRKVDADELAKFSELYKVSIDDLLNGKKIDYSERAFARGFDKLSEKDKKEILDLIKLKSEYKRKGR